MGSISLAEVFEKAESDDVVGKLKVLALLESLPGVGKVKARRKMDEIGISDTRRVRGLGEQQRKALLSEFASEGAGPIVVISGPGRRRARGPSCPA